ncbi:MAG TPA: hypothetical protein VKB79_16150 [Bryobacteraceae bacterium]|nr:hypothetical protein [Bryobacteraceae bacterium]
MSRPRTEFLHTRFLQFAVIFGFVVWAGTELFSAFGQISRTSLTIWWVAVAIGAIIAVKLLRLRRPALTRDPVVWVAVGGAVTILVLTGITAAFSSPNSSDAMAYHMPRVVYWAEQGSVRFFPTPYLNQIMLQPLAEFFALHTYVLTGSDRLVNFVQWFGWAGCLIAVSASAQLFGANPRGQAVAALFCATIPSGVLASSGAKNDCLLAFWLITSIYFGLRLSECVSATQPRGTDWRGYHSDFFFLGGSLGLALCTKATAYLFAPWPLLAIFAATLMNTHNAGRRLIPRKLASGLAIALLIAGAINTPQYLRNYSLSGSPLGFDSAQGDGFFRWRNETFGWKQTTSNALRNISEQLGQRSPAWNDRVYRTVLDLHRQLHIDANDPATTWPWTTFQRPKNANHEADAPNPWHGAILILASLAAVQLFLRQREPLPALYSIALLLGFLSFCFYLKWQQFMARLFLPEFVLGAPLVGLFWTTRPLVKGQSPWLRQVSTIAAIALCFFLLDNSRHPALDNWVRPLRGPLSVLKRPRAEQYFADMTTWHNQQDFERAVDIAADTPCNTVGIDVSDFQLEYPFQALLRQRNPSVQFVHTRVDNASRKYPNPVAHPPCAIVCLECAADQKRLALYAAFGGQKSAGQTIVFIGH